MSIRALVVDDEELARRGLRARLDRAGDITMVGECANGRQAIDAIRQTAPDLVFLDIQMPGKSGFDVIDAIGVDAGPHIIFVTAFDEHAVRAFEVHALDYLLKPIDDSRFSVALSRARRALAQARDSDVGRRVASAMASLQQVDLCAAPPPPSDRIAVRTGGRITVLRAAEIDWIEASGDYASLHVGKKAWLLRETIVSLDQRLAAHGFARIHRSTLVNIERVRELRALDNGEFIVTLDDATELKLSRSYRAAAAMLTGRDL